MTTLDSVDLSFDSPFVEENLLIQLFVDVEDSLVQDYVRHILDYHMNPVEC
jgi:hypothetical protein